MSEGTETLREPEGTESGSGVRGGDMDEIVERAEGGGPIKVPTISTPVREAAGTSTHSSTHPDV